MKLYFNVNLREFKSTFLRFFFLVPICTLFSIFYSCNTFERSSESLDYLNHPEIGDIYFLEKEDGYYTFLKIKDIGDDRISFFRNEFHDEPGHYADEISISNSIKLNVINNPRFYSHWTDSIQVIGKDNIHSLYEKGLIFEIKRN